MCSPFVSNAPPPPGVAFGAVHAAWLVDPQKPRTLCLAYLRNFTRQLQRLHANEQSS